MKLVQMRLYQDGDLQAVVDLFGRSVRQIAGRHYDDEQVGAWAPEHPDLELWAGRLETGSVLVAELAGKIAGFAKLDEFGVVDLIFVDPEHERQGVASSLMSSLVTIAATQGLGRLSAEVSVTARPFFEAQGFRVVREQLVKRRGVELRNYSMEHGL